MKKNCIVTSVDAGGFIGGNKAREDIELFCKQEGTFDSFHVYFYNKKHLIKRFIYRNFLLKKQLKRLDYQNIVIQYPFLDEKAFDKFFKYVSKFKNVSIYLIIHDINGLQKNNLDDRKKEIQLFNKVDGLVVHSIYMKKWLNDHGVKNKMAILEIFDYNNPQPFQSSEKYTGTICFPGNLFKSKFLTIPFLNKNIIDIYGPNRLKKYPENVVYRGMYSPEELPSHLNENFGLIWDGDSINTCSGQFGEYLKYNNPHKTSLFISTGIPIIVWKKAAIAKIVDDYNVGLTINSLEELDMMLNNMTSEKYKELKANAKILGRKLRKGFFIKRALKELIYD